MKKNLACDLSLTLFSLATFLVQPVYADSPALKDLKIHIASVQQVLVDPKLADPQKRLQRRSLAVTILHQLFDFQEMSRRALGANTRRYSDRLAEFTPLFVALLEQAYMSNEQRSKFCQPIAISARIRS